MSSEAVSPKDRTIAALISLSAIPFPYAGPLVGYLVSADSPYARYHAIRVVLDEVALTVLSFLLIAASLTWSVVSLLRTGLEIEHIDWKFMLLKAAAFWLILQGLALMNTLTAIFAAVQAALGKHPRRLRGLKRVAARLSGLELPSKI